MKLLRVFALLCLVATGALAQTGNGWLKIEEDVAAATKGPQVTVVHFWAPWCPNSRAELDKNAWSTFIDTNLDVKFVFVTVWSSDDGKAELAKHGLGGQTNLTLLHHPNHVRKGEGKMEFFMDSPVTWIPSTWVFRDGKLRFAFNYGEVRFPILQQLVRDAGDAWDRKD